MFVRSLIATLLTSTLALPALAAPTRYALDPTHTQILFSYSHMGFSNITGRFDSSEGHLIYDAENPGASSIEISTRIASVSTGVAKLDEHLKSADYLDAASFPVARFKSTRVKPSGEGRFEVSGELSLHGVTLPATFQVSLNKIGEHPMAKVPAIGFDASGSIDRAAYGIDKFIAATGPQVKLSITVEARAE